LVDQWDHIPIASILITFKVQDYIVLAIHTREQSDSDSFYIVVIGSGLAGLCAIHSLLEAGIEANRLVLLGGSRRYPAASDVPFAILNPCPGRSLIPKPLTLEAHAFSTQWLRRLTQSIPSLERDVLEIPIVRPFVKDHPTGKRLERSYQPFELPANSPFWMEKYTAELVRQKWPYLAATSGAAVMGPAFCVALPALIQQLNHRAYRAGVMLWNDAVQSITYHRHRWLIQTHRGEIASQNVLLSVGAALRDWFPHLPLQLAEGEMISAYPKMNPIPNVMFSFAGHIAPTADGRLTVGSTYTHPPDIPVGLASKVWAALRPGIESFWPNFPELCDLSVWGGTRCAVRYEYAPIADKHPDLPGLFVLGALASKGLLWTPYLAHRLVHALICPHQTLPTQTQLSRFVDLIQPSTEKIRLL
jgi:glycine/D-amino acid oxidase-like deaminating enzyme